MNDKDIKKQEMITKIFPFELDVITKGKNKDGDEIGLFSGLISTTNLDLVGDIIDSNAFDDTLADYRSKKRRIPIFYQHNLQNVPIGGMNGSQIIWDKEASGWRVTNAELDLGVSLAKDVYSALKKRNLSDLSIGFRIVDQDWDSDRNIRIIRKLSLGEVSIVSHPANQEAVIDAVKGATSYKDLPLADRGRPWSKREAILRVRQQTGSTDSPSGTYRNAFFWFDSANADNFGAYKMPFADVIGGKLTAIPRGIFAAAAVMRGARGGVDIPAGDKSRVISHINRYYSKMGLESPLKSKALAEHYDLFAGLINNIEEEKERLPLLDSMGDIEDALQEKGFTANQRRILISKIKEFSAYDRDDQSDFNQTDDWDDYSFDSEDMQNLSYVAKSLSEFTTNLKRG